MKSDALNNNISFHFPEPNLSWLTNSIADTYDDYSNTISDIYEGFWPPNHQLIILGNGFDLECGLPSSYEDFIKARFKKLFNIKDVSIETQNLATKDFVNCEESTVWDLILKEEGEALWNNIESVIKEWVVLKGDKKKRNSHVSRVFNLLKDYAASFSIRLDNRNRHVSFLLESERPEDGIHIKIVRYVINTNIDACLKWGTADFLSYLMIELNRFEEAFKSYLANSISEEYKSRSSNLFSRIVSSDIGGIIDIDKDPYTLLNFNFTNPDRSFIGGDNCDIVNIHGSLETSVVFGIDANDCLDEQATMRFSKTYRLMSLRTAQYEQIVHYGYNNGCGTKIVKFYGHSLAKSDYSYFQSIFDSLNIYSSDVKLIFYYKELLGNDRSFLSMCDKVSSLINEYGTTMDNLDHGKNLLHKLLIEGRLFVYDIYSKQI